MITYANVNYDRLAAIHAAQLASRQGRARVHALVLEDFPGYPQPLYRGDPAKKNLVVRKLKELDEHGHRRIEAVGRWRGIDRKVLTGYRSERYVPSSMAAIRATHGVGRPFLSTVRYED